MNFKLKRLNLSFKENALLGYQGELERLRGQIKSFNEEMGTDLLSQLTSEDQEEVSISFHTNTS